MFLDMEAVVDLSSRRLLSDNVSHSLDTDCCQACLVMERASSLKSIDSLPIKAVNSPLGLRPTTQGSRHQHQLVR